MDQQTNPFMDLPDATASAPAATNPFMDLPDAAPKSDDVFSTLHSYLDPIRVLAGKAGTTEPLKAIDYLPALSMAVPAGPKPVSPTMVSRAEVGSAALRQGVQMPNAALKGPIQRNVAAKLSDLPIIGTPIEKNATRAVGQIGEAATRVEQGYGGQTASEAGQAARDSLSHYMQGTSRANQNKLYSRVDAAVNPNVKVPLSETLKTIQRINAERTNAGLGTSKAVSAVEEAATRPGGMNFAGIKRLRTDVGESGTFGVESLFKDMTNAERKMVYGALSKDLEVSIQHGGPKAQAAFGRANRYTALVEQRRKNLMRIVGAKNDEGIVTRIGAAASNGSRADLKLLSQARKSTDPAAWDGVASSVVSKLGRAPNGEFSPDRFVTSWGKLSPEGKRLLFRSTGKDSLAQSLDDIALLSNQYKQLSRYMNTSKTGGTVATLGGLYAEPLTALHTIVSGRVLAHLLARPVTARAVANWSRAHASRNAKAIALASKPLSIAISSELGVPHLASRIMAELQGTTAGEAEQQPDEMPR